jgi:hypothetical protein
MQLKYSKEYDARDCVPESRIQPASHCEVPWTELEDKSEGASDDPGAI